MAYNKSQKLQDNIAAIKLVLQLSKEGRTANDDERAVLRRYSGFGGLKFILNPAASDEDKRHWKISDQQYFRPVRELYAMIHEYASDEKEERAIVDSVKRSVNTAFYTPGTVIDAIASVFKERGVDVRAMLDPSAGIGKFGDSFKQAYDSDISVSAFEKDVLTGMILSALNPKDRITVDGFETIPAEWQGTFDLATSNIPFGDIRVMDDEYRRSKNDAKRYSVSTIHNYFFLKALDQVREGGFVAFITSRGFMDSPSNNPIRQEIAKNARLVGAFRLPDGMFRDEAGTDVGSDLVVLQKVSGYDMSLDTETQAFCETSKGFESLSGEDYTDITMNTYWWQSMMAPDAEVSVSTNMMRGTDSYGKPTLVFTHNGGMDGIARQLKEYFSRDLHREYIDYYQEHALKIEEAVVEQQPEQHAQRPVEDISVSQQKPLEQQQQPQGRPQGRSRGHAQQQAQSAPVQLDLFSMWDEMDNGSGSSQEEANSLNAEREAQEAARREEERKRKEPRAWTGDNKEWYRSGTVVVEPNTHHVGVLNGNVFTPLTNLTVDQAGRLRQYVLIRDAYHELYDKEAELRKEQPELREALNRHYDNFFLQYGRLNERRNARVIMMDALGRDGLTLENESGRDFVKADIFERPVSFISYEITHVDTPEEALSASLNRYGKVDLEYMAGLTGNKSEEMPDLLKGQIYYMPDGSYVIASKALSGNVYEKLEYVSEALDMIKGQEPGEDIDASIIPALEETKDALTAVIPEQIAFDDIGLQFGERWIPTEYYEDYIGKLFNTKMEIHYAEHIDEYSLKAEDRWNLKIREEFCVRGEYKDYDGMALLAHAFHNTTPDIQKCVGYDENGEDLKGPDMEKIQLANTKIDEIRDGFTEYLTNLPKEKRDELQEMYNRKFNCFVKAKYDGSYQTFPGIDLKALASPKFNIQNIYKSQKDCVKMILENGGGICDHEVGTGKSLIMCMAAHEMHRLGIAYKPMIIAMKANVAEIAATYQAAFPDDKILYASEKDFSPANRVQFFSRIKNNDYACVIMSHDQFGKIPQAMEIQEQILQDEIRDIDEALNVIRQQGGNISGRMLTGLEKRKENMYVKLLELQSDMAKRKDDFVDFNRMGIDHIFIDESHQFKNLMFTTRHQRVSGLGNPGGSQKALNLLYAIRTIQNRTGKDLGATFLSGTTISNSLTELYLLFKYLRPEAMAKQGIHSFDAWAAVYAKKTSDYEFSVTNAVVQKERFRYFVKVPELATFYNEITDYRTGEDVGLDRPNMNVILHDIEPTADQKDFNERLVQFAQTGDGELIFRAPLNDREMKGKMLIATDASRKASMDMRLVSQELFGDDPNNKASHCARLVSEYYQKFNEQKGTQFIFSDLSTYKPNEWNIFQEIKDKLVNDYGIPAEEVRFIQEASSNKVKQKMIDLMNEGKIRVLFGSTSTLGTGVNAQQRAVAVHHIDIPWRPSDLEQRNGRARRTGNWVAKEFAGNNVDIIIYAVKRTLDSYKFNLLQNKQLFITQLKTNQLGTRVIDEGAMDEENGMNFAEYVAILSGNDDLLQKAKLEKKIMALESERKTYMQARRDTEWRLENAREKLGKNEVIINGMTEDYERYQSQVKKAEDGTLLPGLVMNNVSEFTPDGSYNIEEMGAALQDAGRTVGNKDRQMGTVYGFPLMVDTLYAYDEKLRKEVYAGNKFYVKGHYLYEHNNGKLAMSKDNRLGAVRYGVNALEKIPGVIAQYQERNEKLRADIAEYERIAGKPWGKEDELKGLKKEMEALDAKIRESLDETTKNMPKVEEKPYKFSKEGKLHKVVFPRDAYPFVSISEMREFADTGSWRNRGYVRCGNWDGDVMVSDPEVEGEFTLRQKAEEFIAKVEETNSERKENLDWLIVKAKENTKGDKVHQDNEVIFAAREALQKEGVDWQNVQEPPKGIVPTQEEMETGRLLVFANTKDAHTLPLSNDLWQHARLMLDDRGIDWHTGLPINDVSKHVLKWRNASDNQLSLYAQGVLSRGRVFHPGDAAELTAKELKQLDDAVASAKGPFKHDGDRRDAYERLMILVDYLGEQMMERGEQADIQQPTDDALLPGAEFYQQYINEHFEGHSESAIIKLSNALVQITDEYTKMPDWYQRESILAQMRVQANRNLRANGFGGAKDIVELMMNHVMPQDQQRDLAKMRVYSAGQYGGTVMGEELRTIAHQVKEYGTDSSVRAVVDKMIGIFNNIPNEDLKKMVLIPMPGASGYPGYMEKVVNELGERTGLQTANSLFSTEHVPLYDLKKNGTAYEQLPDIMFEMDGTLPAGTIVVLVDNVLDTGKTLLQASKADFGEGVEVRAAVLAHTDNYQKHNPQMEVKTIPQLREELNTLRDQRKAERKAGYEAAVAALEISQQGADAAAVEEMKRLLNVSWNSPFGGKDAKEKLNALGVDWQTGEAIVSSAADHVSFQFVAKDYVSTVTDSEKAMLSLVAMDLMSGNYLLGRRRPDGYREFMAEIGGAFAAVKTLSVTARQRDLLVALSGQYHEGYAELASQADVSEDVLKEALSRVDGMRQGVVTQIMTQPYHIYHEDDAFVLDYEHGFGLAGNLVEQVAKVHDGEIFERAGRKMVLFDSERSMQGFIDNIRTLNVSYTNDLRDALVARLRAAGISVNTDWQEGERVLAQATGVREHQTYSDPALNGVIPVFAEKYHLPVEIVRSYFEGMGNEDLHQAQQAYYAIRRAYKVNLKTDLGEAYKLSAFSEKFTELKNELYNMFGDVDALRDREVQKAQEYRNMMDAARREAEKRVQAEYERLQPYRDMSDAELDELYMQTLPHEASESHPISEKQAAIDSLSNDQKALLSDLLTVMQERRGYTGTTDYQGQGAWVAPGNPGYASDEERRAKALDDSSDVNIEDIAKGITPQPEDYFSNLRAYGHDTKQGEESARAIREAIETIQNTGEVPMVHVYRAVPKDIQEGMFRNGDWVTMSPEYAKIHGELRFGIDNYRVIRHDVPANQLWWDGNDINEWGFDDGKDYQYKNTLNNRKSNDLVTFDDKGNVIPLSNRFDERKADIRFFRSGEHQAYGFVYNGTIYIDPRIATAETPLHEYTHLWAEVLRQRNPQEWQNIVQMMKDTPEVWNYVKQNYPHLKTDDQIADEALAQFSGKRGYQKLQKFVNGHEDKTILDKMMEVLGKFWARVAEFFSIHYTSKEEVADRILYDLLNEVNPLDYRITAPSVNIENPVVLGENPFARIAADKAFFDNFFREQQEKQIESANFKEWFGDWHKPSVYRAYMVDDVVGLKDRYPSEFPQKFYDHSTVSYGLQEMDDREGQQKRMHIIGRLTTEKVDVLVVDNPESYNEYAHITLATAEGVKPVESNAELEKHAAEIVPLDDYVDVTFKNVLNRNLSKVVDVDGKPLVVYHQTANDFTVFDPRHKGSGSNDYQLPFGIFMKPSPRNIGVGGEKQMALYANIHNPLRVMNREELSRLLESKVEGYRDALLEYEQIDRDFSKKFDESEKFDYDRNVENWNKWKAGEMTEEEYQNAISDTAEDVVNQWTEAQSKPISKMKELVDDYFRNSEYDGIWIAQDEGSFGRSTETIIAFDPIQVKSATANIGLFSKENPDIRFHFIGEQGATNLDVALDGGMYIFNLRHAEKLEKIGRSPLDIKIETGWERGADGQWRLELPSFTEFDAAANLEWLRRHPDTVRYLELLRKENAHLFGGFAPLTEEERAEYEHLRELPDNKYWNPGTTMKNSDRLVLEDFVSSPLLFMAYPELRHVVMRVEEMEDRGAYATRKSVVDGSDIHYIRLNKDMVEGARGLNVSSRQQMKSTIAHEVQHYIQEQEGFARGNDVRRINGASDFELNVAAWDGFVQQEVGLEPTYDVIMSYLKGEQHSTWRKEFGPGYQDMMKDLVRMSENMDADTFMKNYEYFRDNGLKGEAWTQYWVSMGEVESRNVQARMGMSMEQRRHTLAVDTEDVPRERQTANYTSVIAASRDVLEQPVQARKLTAEDREAGGALVDHLQAMGITVHTDNRENRRVLKAAEKDQSEVGKVRHFKTEQGEIYGFAYKGEIHLDLRKLDAELPLHEFAHLFCQAMQRINPDNWNHVVGLLKQDAETWNAVKRIYPELTADNDIAEEAIAQYSGKRGAEKLQAELERMTTKDANYGSRWGNIYQNVAKAIQDFWKHIGDSVNIEYSSKEDIADQILNDFAKNVNPVRKMERWLEERDKEYAAAVEVATKSGNSDDWSKAHAIFVSALQENVGNGVTPIMAVDGYRGKLDRLARDIKDVSNTEAIKKAVDLMAPRIPANAVLVPAPSHLGYATDTLVLARALSERTDVPVADILKSDPRERQYDVKKATGHPLTAEQLGIRKEGELPEGKMPFIIDNVVNSGNTAEACVKALGHGIVYSLASATSQERHAATLKSAETAVYDKQGQLIPLSERFELKNKWLGRVMNYKPLDGDVQQPVVKEPDVIQGLEGYSVDDVKSYVENSIDEILEDAGLSDEISVKNVTVIGSRSRGEAHDGSDLDILLEYDGDFREDALFDLLHEEGLDIEGINIDINPINPHYSLTTEEWLARDAKWREEDRRKAGSRSIEKKEIVESKNIRSMQTSVIKSNLQVLADRLLPGTQSRVRFLKPQDPDRPSAVGGEIYRREDGIHVFRENQDVPLSSIDDRNELTDLYRSLLEYSIANRLGNGKGMNFPEGTTIDGYEISTAAVANDGLRVMGTRDGAAANSTYYITMEGLEELDKLVEQRLDQDRQRDYDPIGREVENYRQIMLSATGLKEQTDSISKLYDELNSLSSRPDIDVVKLTDGIHQDFLNDDPSVRHLNNITNDKLRSFVVRLSKFYSPDEVQGIAKGIQAMRSSYSEAHIVDLYDKTVGHYAVNTPSRDTEEGRALDDDLAKLLTVKDGVDLMKWVNESSSHDSQEPLELLKATLGTKSVYEADHILTTIHERDLEPEHHAQVQAELPKNLLEQHYAFAMSYYISNSLNMGEDEKALFKQLDNATTAEALQRWASEVRIGRALEGLDLPVAVRDEVDELAWQISETNDDVLQNETLKGISSIGIVNDLRKEALDKQLQSLVEQYPDDVILFRSGKGMMSTYGASYAAIEKQTGWEGRRLDDNTDTWLNITSDGYNVLTEKDINLRVVTPNVSIRPLAEKYFDELAPALQTIDYNVSFVKDKPVLVETDGSLKIDDFKVKTLDFHPTGLTVINETGESIMIRDIPTNYFHPQGTLVVADYINGHRQTVERSLEAERPVSAEIQAKQTQLLASYKDVKAVHENETVLFRQKGFLEAFGQEADRVAEKFGVPVYERNIGGEDVHFVMIPTEKYASALEDGVDLDLFVAKAQVDENRRDIRSTISLNEQIAVEHGRAKLGVSVTPIDNEGRYQIEVFNPDTKLAYDEPMELSKEDAEKFRSLEGMEHLSERSDLVMALADKYFSKELEMSDARSQVTKTYDNMGMSYTPLMLLQTIDFKPNQTAEVEHYNAVSVDPPYIMLYETMGDAEKSMSPRMLTDLPLDLQQSVLEQLKGGMFSEMQQELLEAEIDKGRQELQYSKIDDVEHRPISSVNVTILNIPEQRIAVALNGYDGSVHELDVTGGVIQGGVLTFADGNTTDLNYMIGTTLESQLGKTLAGQIESMDMSDTVEHPIIDNGASIWDFYADQIGLGLDSELRDKLNGLIPESGNRLVLNVPISTTLLGKEFGERNIVGFANNNGYFSAQTDKGESADIDRLVISGLVASHKQIDGQHYTCKVAEQFEQAQEHDTNSMMTVEQLQEKAVSLFGQNFKFDYWNETEAGTKIDRIDLGDMPDTISIDKLEVKDGKLSLYSNDIGSDVDLQALDVVEILKIDASLDDIKVYLDNQSLQQAQEQHINIDDQLEHVGQLTKELGLEYVPFSTRLPITVPADTEVDWREEDKVFTEVMCNGDNVTIYQNHQDSYDDNNGVDLYDLPKDLQKEVLDLMEEKLTDGDRQMTVYVDTARVPEYAVGAIVNGDNTGLTDESIEMVREFTSQYPNHIFNVRDNSSSFNTSPAFGNATNCVDVDIVRIATPKQLRQEVLDKQTEKLQQRYNDFVKEHGEQPLYAEVTIRFKDDNVQEVAMIKLSEEVDPATDDKIFFNVDNFEGLKDLLKVDNGEDFDVIDIEDTQFYDKSLYQAQDKYIAFGQEVPQETIDELKADGVTDFSTENLEKLLHFEAQDNDVPTNDVNFDELPYHISYGDDPTGVIEGDVHVQFTKELAYVSFEDFKHYAEDLGGSVRMMNNERWADFFRQDDAEKFANTVVDVNVSRMEAARAGAKEQPKVTESQDRDTVLAEVKEKISQTENKEYSPDDVAILKEAAIAHIEKYNSDYYQAKGVDIKGMIEGSDVKDRHSLSAAVASVVFDIHSEAIGRESDILERLLPNDMSRADETFMQGRDISGAAEAILDSRQNHLKEAVDAKVAEVNATLKEYNRMSQAADPNFMFSKHVESYALEQQSENEFALSDPGDRNFVTSWMGAREMLAHLVSLLQKMFEKFPELMPSHEDKAEKQDGAGKQAGTEKPDGQKKTSKWDNLDYTKYVLPEGADIKNKRWKFIKPQEGEQYGKYHIMCDFMGKHYEREMYGNDIKAFFEKDDSGQRTNRVTLDQLVAKYFGKQFAEAMSIGSVQEAEHVRAEQKDAKEQAVDDKEDQVQQQADKEKESAQRKAAEEKKAAEEAAKKKAEDEQKAEKKEKVPAIILQSSLLVGALLAAKENGGVWLNKDGKAAPVLHQSGTPTVSAFNGLMMALHSDAHGYKTNDYTTFNAAKGDGCYVKGGETGIPFNWYNWDKYVNRFNANEVIDKEAYDALAPEEKELYKVQRIKEERSIFNIDQTTMPEVKKDAYNFILESQDKDSVYRGAEESAVQPVSLMKQFADLKEKHPDTILLMRDGNGYNLYGEDSERLSGLLGLEVKDHDPEGNEIKYAAFPQNALDINLPKMIRAGHRVAICDQLGDIRSSQRHGAADAIYNKAVSLEDALVKLGGNTNKVMKEPFFDTAYDSKDDTLRFTDRRYYEPGNEISTALQRVNDSFRAAAAYTGGESRLNRVAHSTMLPGDAEKYDRLVSELAAGVLMSRAGLPATLSKESMALIPYWERELKESPKLMESVERDVNNAVEVLEKIKAGEAVNYSAIRGEKAFDAIRPKLYTIANELASIPDANEKHVVVVKDQQNKSAAVILPAGASLEVNNEIPGMNKNRFLIALRKQGFENVQFYNAGGALGLNQSNEFFADKTVEVAKLKQYDLNVVENLDLSEEIERSMKVDLQQVQVTFDDNMHPVLYVKPVDGESFTVYPEPSDVKLFFDNVRSPEFDTIRENLGQKYYGLVSRHPDLKTDILMPKVPSDLDLSRISKVNITKDRYKPESTIIFATIDGQQQKPIELSQIEAQRYWLVDDKNLYKLLVAAQKFEEQLHVDNGQTEGGQGQFHDSREGSGVDSSSPSAEASSEEDKQERKGGIRM